MPLILCVPVLNFVNKCNLKQLCITFWIVDVDGRIILRWIFRKWEGVVGTEWSWFRIGTGGGRL
jgi:hypothetical protein